MSPVERRLPWILVIGTCAVALACGSLESPTEPKPNPSSSSSGGSSDGSGGNSGLVLGAPAPAASPSPSPSPEGGQPSPSPTPSSGAEGAAECGQPVPPAITIFDVKVHLRGSDSWTLDSTPLVGPDAEYCRKIGFTDGRSVCPVRPEGNPQRAACELYAVGRAKDTSKPGPTWYLNGGFCRGKSSGCENNGDNQYLLRAYASGMYKACASSGVCGELEVAR